MRFEKIFIEDRLFAAFTYVSRLTIGVSDRIAIGVYWPEDYVTFVEHVLNFHFAH